jgi:hypothetical protein
MNEEIDSAAMTIVNSSTTTRYPLTGGSMRMTSTIYKMMLLVAAVFLFAGLSTTVNAQLITSDDFNYTDLALLTSNGWVAHSAGGTAAIDVGSSNGLTYAGYSGVGGVTGVVVGNAARVDNTGEDDSKTFTAVTSGTLYWSFLLKVPSATAGYFIHLGGSTSAFASRVYVKPSATAGKMNIGLSNTGTAAFAVTPTDFDTSATYLVIVKYDVSLTGAGSIWVKASGVPASEAAAGTPELTTTGSGIASVDRVCLRQYSSTQSQIVDGIRVGYSWASILGSNASDIITNGSFTFPTNINYSANTGSNVTSSNPEIYEFTIRDGGATTDADALSTTLTAITFSVTNSSALEKVALYDGTTELAEVTAGSSISFSSLTAAAADGGTKTLNLRATYKTTQTDNTQFSFTVTSATADNTGSSFAAANAGGATSSTSGDNNRIEVTATKYNFSAQPPASTTVNTNFSASVNALDANNNLDLDATTSVTLAASAGTLSSTTGLVQNLASGAYSWTDLQNNTAGTGVTLSATGSLTTANSTSMTIYAAMPSTQASAVNFTSVTTTSMNVNWTSGNGANRIVIARQGSAVSVDPSAGTTYSGNSDFTLATDLGSGNKVVYVGSGSTFSLTNLTQNTAYHFAVYEYNGGSGTANYKTPGATGNQTTSSAASTSSDIIDAGNTTSNIAYANYQAASIATTSDGVRLWSFTLRDGGGSPDGDSFGTELHTITINKGGSNTVANWANTLRRAALFNGSTLIQEVAVTGESFVFTGMSGSNVTAPDDGSITLDLYVTFESAVSDNEQFQFTSNNGVCLTGPSNTSFLGTFTVTSPATADANRIEVTASKLDFTTQPSTSAVASVALGTQPVVTARDANNNTDLDYTGTVTLTNSGALAMSNNATAAASGVVTYSGFSLNASGSAITLSTTNGDGLTNAPNSNAITVLEAEPSTQASVVNFTAVTGSTLTVNWTNGNGANRIVLMKSGSAVSSDPSDGFGYAANAAFGTGDLIGTGNYVIYNGSGSSVPVTGLTAGVTYHVAVYEYNGSGGLQNYKTPGALGSQQTSGQTYVWTATGSAAFGTSTNWTPNRTSPLSSDVLEFSGGGAVTATGVTTQTIGQLNVINNTTVALQASAAAILTIGGGPGTDLTVAAGSVLNSDGTSALTITVATGATASISGNMTFSGAAHKLLAIDASGITFNSGAIFTTSTGFSSNPFGTANANSVVFASGSSYVYNTGSNPFGLAAPASVTVFQSGSNFYSRSASPSLSGRNYANLIIQNNSSVTSGGSRSVEFQNLDVESGSSFAYRASNDSVQIRVKGNVTSAGTGNIILLAGNTGGLQFASGTQSIGGGGGTGFIRIASTTIASGTTLTLARNIEDSSSAINVNGILDASTFTISGGGGVVVNSAATLKTANTSGSGALAAGITATGGLTLNSGSTVEYNGAAAQFAASRTFSNMTMNNANGLTLLGDATVNGTLTLSSGNITTGSNNVIVGGSGTISRTSGYIVGNLRQNYASTGSKVFTVGTANGYSPVTVDVTAGSGDLTVKANQGAHPTPFSTNALQRYWSLTGTGLTADLTFQYLLGDVVGNESNYAVRKYNAGWTAPGGSVDAVNHRFSITGVTSFSDWSAAECATITLNAAPDGIISQAYSHTYSASGGQGSYTYSVTSGSLPPGVTLTGAALSGTPTATGTYNYDITATDANGCTGVLSETVVIACPVITLSPPSIPNGQNGIAYNAVISASGGVTPYTFSTTGTLPTGLSLSSGGVISGTPTSNGAYNFYVVATDSNGCADSLQYSITVTNCPVITVSTPAPDGTVGAAYGHTYVATGGVSPYTYSVTGGTIPPGTTFLADALSGTPTTPGKYAFAITVLDSNSCSVVYYDTVVVCGTIGLAPSSPLTAGVAGSAYSQNITASGSSSPYTYAVTGGALPTGMTLSAAGLLSGTPTVTGPFSFTVTATDTFGCTGAQLYSLTINCPVITLAPPTLPAGTTGVAYSQTVSASGGIGTYTFTLSSGTLPTGLSLASGGALTGTPTVAGTYNFVVRATDTNGCNDSLAYSISVSCPTITVNPATLPNGNVSFAYSATVTATGGTGPYTFVNVGSLPTGLTLASGGAISGTPTVAGTFVFTVDATDANGCIGTRLDSITILPASVSTIANGNWSNAAIWSQGAVPTSVQNVLVGHAVTLDGAFSAATVTVSGAGDLDLGSNVLTLSGAFSIQAGGTARQFKSSALSFPNTLVDIPGASGTQVFAPTSNYYIRGKVEGLASDTATFGNLYWGSTGNGTPPPGTVIAGNLVKDSVGEIRGGTSTVSRMIKVMGNMTINAGTVVTSNSTSPATGGWDVDGNVTINAGGALRGVNFTGTGTLQVGGSLVNSGGKIFVEDANGGSGAWTVYFKGSGAGTFNPGDSSAFRNIAIAPGRTITLLDTATVNTSYALTDSGVFLMGTNILKGAGGFNMLPTATLGIGHPQGVSTTTGPGNIAVTGTRTFPPAGTGSYIYNGLSAQSTGDGTLLSAANLTINNAAGVSCPNDFYVAGTLTLTNGNLDVAAATKTLFVGASGSVSRTSGHVVGRMSKHFALGATVSNSFEVGDPLAYAPVDVTLHTVSVGESLAVSTVGGGEHPNLGTSIVIPGKDVNRYYRVENQSTVFGTADATFYYPAGEVDLGANTAAFAVAKYDAPNWTYPTVGTRTSTSTQATGMTSFSEFAIGELQSWTITVTQGLNGTIAPGTTTVLQGGSQSFTVTPDLGYGIDSIFVDGAYAGNTSPVAFTNVTANHTITAKYLLASFTITVTQNPNGTITPGTTSVSTGGSQAFTMTPLAGFHVDSVMVDGAKVDSLTSYTFVNVQAAHTITAFFSVNTYTLTVNVNGSGSVGRSINAPTYNHGTPVSLTATPALGWVFVSWSGDTSGNANPLHITITANTTITALFQQDAAYLVEYRSFASESLAVDKDNKGKIGKYVKRKADKVDFQFAVKAPRQHITIGLKFSMLATCVITDSATGDTLVGGDLTVPQKEFFPTGWVEDSTKTYLVTGRGYKGKQIKTTVVWSGGPILRAIKVVVLAYNYNTPRLPMPNRVNALFETYLQGGFTSTNGLLVGEDRSLDSAKQYGWVRAEKYTDVLKTLYVAKTSTQHTGQPRGFKTTVDGKPFVKLHKSIAPTKFNNVLLAEMIAMKFNIAASMLEKIPVGFGELVYDDGTSNPLNGLMVKEIATLGDSLMMGIYVSGSHTWADSATFGNFYATVNAINHAFEGPIDTLNDGFATKLKMTGVRPLADVPFLRVGSELPAKIVPMDVVMYEAPVAYKLDQNYPNPFNPTTTISFELPQSSIVTLKVYNMLGQEVASLLDNQELEDGTQEFTFDATSLASGVYFYRLTAQAIDDADGVAAGQLFVNVKKMMLLK